MKAIIVGSGQIGYSTAVALARDGIDVVVIDMDAHQLTNVRERVDVQTIVGNGASPAVLRAAGADDADMVLAVSNNDEVNLVACHICNVLFKTPTKLAYLRNPDYDREQELFSGRSALAVDAIISPEKVITSRVREVIEHQGAGEVVDFANRKLRLLVERVTTDAQMIGQPISQLVVMLPRAEGSIIAVYRDQQLLPIDNSIVIQQDDEVYIAATSDTIFQFIAVFTNEASRRNRRITIAGAGNVGLALAFDLESRGYQVKMIESREESARIAADQLHNTVVLNGDATDEGLLLQENIDQCDVFCAVTNKDEVNVLSAFVGKRLGARKAVVLVNRKVYSDLLYEEGKVDVIISPAESMVGSILKHVRRADIVNVHSLRSGMAEAIELIVHGDEAHSKVIGKCAGDIKLPPGVRWVAIVREGNISFDVTDIELQADDSVILFAADRDQIIKVEQLFQVGVGFI